LPHNGGRKEATMTKTQLFVGVLLFTLLTGMFRAMGVEIGALPWFIFAGAMWWVSRKR
jgi:hypothetical protein